jgi:hypothetical protein
MRRALKNKLLYQLVYFFTTAYVWNCIRKDCNNWQELSFAKHAPAVKTANHSTHVFAGLISNCVAITNQLIPWITCGWLLCHLSHVIPTISVISYLKIECLFNIHNLLIEQATECKHSLQWLLNAQIRTSFMCDNLHMWCNSWRTESVFQTSLFAVKILSHGLAG